MTPRPSEKLWIRRCKRKPRASCWPLRILPCSKTALIRPLQGVSPFSRSTRTPPASKRLFFIGTNNYQGGLIGGQRLAQELKGKSQRRYFQHARPAQYAGSSTRLQGRSRALAQHQDHASGRYPGRSSHCFRHHHTNHRQRAGRLPGTTKPNFPQGSHVAP
jgi:hypothetical protein